MDRRAIGFVAVGLAVAPAAAAPSISLAEHRAIYDLSLADAGNGSDVASISGRMVMEFTGSACAGYTTKLRFVTRTEAPDGDSQVIDSRSSIFEAGDGKSLEFSNETYTDETLSEESRGTAKRVNGDIAVSLTRPARKSFDLTTSVLFPTEQMETIIGGALSGQHFLSLEVYDGSEDGETVFSTAGVIGPEAKAGDGSGDAAVVEGAGVGGLRHWPVTISYFKKDRSDETPYYTMSFVVYENGIGRSLKIDYGDFSLTGKLTQLDLLPAAPACK